MVSSGMRNNHGYTVASYRPSSEDVAFGANPLLRWQIRGPWPLHGIVFERREEAEALLASLVPCRCGEWHRPTAPILAHEGHGVPA